MAEAQQPTGGHESMTLRFAKMIVKHRVIVAFLLIASTSFFGYPIFNTVMTGLGAPLPGPVVRIDTNARDQWPDHPFIHAQDKFSAKFGSATTVAIGVVVKEGTIFTPETLQKIDRITRNLDGVEASPELPAFDSQTDARDDMRDQWEEDAGDEEVSAFKMIRKLDRVFPPYPVNHDQVRSVSHRSTRVFEIQPDGAIENRLLMPKVPETQEEADAIRELVRQNPPVIFGRYVSYDEKAALITANFVTDRLSGSEVYSAVFDHVQRIKAVEEDENTHIFVSGVPILVGWILVYAFQIGLYVLLTIAMIFILLWAYFRRWHGVFIPFIAALATVIWGLGYTGWRGLTFDPLILVIPMIITARAVSHTVQMAERFFEDYEIMLPRYSNPDEAKREVATIAMGELIIPGTLGIVTDVAGLLAIMVTTIPQMRALGEFGAFWVLSIIVTVEILHPILICFMPAPTEHEHFLPEFMIRFTRFVGNTTTHPTWKYVIAGVTIFLFISSTWITLNYSKVGEASPGTPLLWPDAEWNQATAMIATKFGGVDTFVVYADGDKDNASGDAEPVQRMEELERWMEANTDLGASVSVVPFMKAYNGQNHFGDPKWGFVPRDSASVRAALFQLRQNGAPGFLRPFMTDDGRYANLALVYRDHKGDTLINVSKAAEAYIKTNPIGQVIVRLDKDHAERDAGFFNPAKVKDNLYYMLGPLLPERGHTLNVQIRQPDGEYSTIPVNQMNGEESAPDWLESFTEEAIWDYEDAREGLEEGDVFTWPETLAEWDASDVQWWWESEEYGIRAVGVSTRNLIVHDTKAVDSVPRYQPTNSWTRGMQFVLAGGIMGILAATNDEVERSHVANIALIFLIIFVLHSITYQSVPSGFIILLQIATATMLSLAYMAVKGVGLNINTLPVQSVGVGIGVDYAIYIVDRIRQETADTGDLDEAVRRAVRTTGMAVTFTATTIVGGIAMWALPRPLGPDLRFQGEMAQLLTILMVINMLGAITVVPAFYSIFRPKVATALLTDEQMEALRIQKEAEVRKGLRDE
ncbi:MAG: MMPL family transporter [bacterium]|nr:MMPL family transporter [bacterium]